MKKLLVLAYMLVVLSVFVFAAPVYKYENTVPITDTVFLTNVREFHSDHNISYSYIKMDLHDQRVKLKLLKSDEGTDILSYMSDLAGTDKNTVAALNGDFFSVHSGKKGFSLGIEKKDGEYLQSPINPDTMATVAYDGSNVLMTYLDFHVMAVAPNWEYREIRHINKHTSYYGEILMYTSDFNGGYSPAPGGNVVEVVVEDDKIKEFRRNMEPCLIPENGCVLVVSEGSSMFFANNFNVGDDIHFDWYVTPSLDEFDMALGAGSMLVYEGKDVGKIGDYTHTVAGFNPRSAMGIDKEGRYLYLVAVDGRQTSSRGMRMSHLAELMIELGCYNAVNLDGGGSTRMVASTLWNEEMHPVNSPTENRRVINAVGIVLNNDDEEVSEKTENDCELESDENSEVFDEEYEDENEKTTIKPFGIDVKAEKYTAFVGEKVKVDVAVFDEQMRNAEYEKDLLIFEVSQGEINDGFITSDVGGHVTLSVFLDELYAETTVYFMDSVSGIVTDGTIRMGVGESKKIPFYVFDSIGRFLKVEDSEQFEIFSSDDGIASVKEGVLIAHKDGKAKITILRGSAVSYIDVYVGAQPLNYLYDFEEERGSLALYPDDTKGEFQFSDEVSLSGVFSGKLSFDFTTEEHQENVENVETVEALVDESEVLSLENPESSGDEETIAVLNEAETDVSRAVYFSFKQNVRIYDGCDSVSMSVYSDDEFLHTIKAQLVDGEGKVKNVSFDGGVEKAKWNTLTLEIPDNLPKPVYLSRVYVLYTPGEQKDCGNVYFDDISFVSAKEHVVSANSLNSYRYSINNSNVKGDVLVGAKSSVDFGLVSAFRDIITENTILSENGYIISDEVEKNVSEDDFAVYISLDTSNGGIRNTDSSQWDMLTLAVKESSRKNVFLMTNDSVFGNDDFENEVICDFLASFDKNVFVISRGDSPSYMNIKGVNYFTLDSTPDSVFSYISEKSKNGLKFYFGDTVTFEFLSI